MKLPRIANLLAALGLLLVFLGLVNTFTIFQNWIFPSNVYGSSADEVVVQGPTFLWTATPVSTAIPGQDGMIDENGFSIPNEGLGVGSNPKTGVNSAGLIPVTGASDSAQTDTKELGAVPERIRIPAIDLDAPIVLAKAELVRVEGKDFIQWLAPDEAAAGWQESSARLGVPGNTVLNGHHNINGEVFANLVNLKVGDRVIVSSDYQALDPENPYSDFIDADQPGAQLTSGDLFKQVYTDQDRVVFQTCIDKNGNASWGRLFVIATPLPDHPVGFSGLKFWRRINMN